MTFLDPTVMDEIIAETDGVRVVYRGRSAYFHFEKPSVAVLQMFKRGVTGMAKLLIGQTSSFPNLERKTLIEVDGDNWIVGDFVHPEDGGVIYIALTQSTRT